MELNDLLFGLIIFFARVTDVSLGTIRTIAIVQGKPLISFFVGLFEVTIWILVVSQVVTHINDNFVLVLFFALGYASGNVVGIFAEKKLTFGISILRVISCRKGPEIAERIRKTGQPVTLFQGEGLKGPVYELYIALKQKNLNTILSLIKKEDPSVFFIIEQAKASSKLFHWGAGSLQHSCPHSRRMGPELSIDIKKNNLDQSLSQNSIS